MRCSGSCKPFCRWIEGLPLHRKFVLKKKDYPHLPECFRTTFLGESVPGALRQFRGPHGAHVHEFDDRWVLHRDRADADEDPLGHLLKDAPEYLASLGTGLLTALLVGRGKKKNQALAAGWALATFTLLLGKMEKAISEDEREHDGQAPPL